MGTLAIALLAVTQITYGQLKDAPVNIKDPPYSAKGAGSDETTVIQAAVTAAAAAGRPLYVPKGTYIVKNIAISSALVIFGDGRAQSVLKLKTLATTDGSPILNITSSGVSIRGLGFDGNKSAQPADGFSDSFNAGANGTGRAYRALIKLYNPGADITSFNIEDCALNNAFGAAVASQNTSHFKARRNTASANNFEMFWVASTTASYYSGIEITNNEMLATASGDATVNANAVLLHRATFANVSNNYADGIERNFLKCESCTETSIVKNTINNITKDSFGGIQLDVDGTSVLIAENVISNTGAGVTVNMSGAGTGYFNIDILGNEINTTLGPSAGDGVAINAGTAASDGISIVGNPMRGIVRYGVRTIGGPLTNVVVQANKIKTQGAVTQAGIVLTIGEPGHSNYSVGGNEIDLGNIQSNASGIYVTNTGGNTVSDLHMFNNFVKTGAHVAYQDSGNIITSGSFSGNYSDGAALFTSTNFLVADTNLLRTSSSWISSSQGRTATTTPVTATIYDQRIITNLGVAGPVAVNLPALAAVIPPGRILTVKDGKGDAATNPITITRGGGSLIDGGTNTRVINTNGGSLTFVWDGTSSWYVLGAPQIATSTQATLGTPANGTFYYCSDCTVANPCAGAGTGALAKRLNGVWVCN